jgi:hypothetical protein
MTNKFASSLLVGSMYLLYPNILRADLLLQEIKNSTASTTASDLTLVFSQALLPNSPLKVTNQMGMSTSFLAPATTTFVIGVGSLPSTFGPGAVAMIKFSAPAGTTIDKTKSFWTDSEGAMIINGLASFGAPPTILFSNGLAFAEFTDTDDVPITYTDISLYANNDLTNFNIDQFDTPTGELVTGVPSAITLDPGDSVSIPFGPVSPNEYELALAEAAAVSNPSDTYSVGAGAAPVPEPSTFALLGLALLLMILSNCWQPGFPVRKLRSRSGRRA